MSASPKPPERLAEILQEILALSNSTLKNPSGSTRGSDSVEASDAPSVKEQSQLSDEEE